MTNQNDLLASIMLFEDIETDQGTSLKSGYQGTLVEQVDAGFIIEFEIANTSIEGGKRFETACLSSDKFAITENLSTTAE